MERGSPSYPDRRKIVDLDRLLDDLKSRRATRREIGLTNGCYDVLHPGHIAMLQDAASYCEDLIVAVDCDWLVRIAKGKNGRPILTFDDRAAMVAALDCVWRVIQIDKVGPAWESNLPALIDAIRPTVYICRQVEPVPEIPAALAADCHIIRLGRHGDWSGDMLRERICQR